MHEKILSLLWPCLTLRMPRMLGISQKSLNGTIGPASLITVANMLGYDRETTRPGAADRAEQTLHVILFKF